MGTHYRARARPNNPAAPAKLMATPAVAIGAPPVEVEDEGEEDLAVDAGVSDEDSEVILVVWPLAVEVIAVAAGVAVTAWVESFPLSAPAAVGVGVAPIISWAKTPPAEVAQALTLAGRLLYQAGMVPASIWLMMESREEGLRTSSYQEAGMAVSRTVMIEVGTRGTVRTMSLGVASWATGEARARVERERRERCLICILMEGEVTSDWLRE